MKPSPGVLTSLLSGLLGVGEISAETVARQAGKGVRRSVVPAGAAGTTAYVMSDDKKDPKPEEIQKVASTGKSSKKRPPASPIGVHMNGLSERMKKHKAQKNVHEALSTMHMSISGHPLDENSKILKTAYEAGAKYAEETVSESNSSTNSALSNTDRSPEEAIVETMRRGWPDPFKKALRENKNYTINHEYQPGTYQERGDIARRSQLTRYSPETTS